MSKIAIKGGATGAAVFTIEAPSTATSRTLTLPDSSGTVATLESIPEGYTDADALTLFSASGSAPVYAARAWVNFNGTGTVAIRSSGNVSSITDYGIGHYGVNFTTSMPDADYSVNGACSNDGGAAIGASVQVGSPNGTITNIDNTTCRVGTSVSGSVRDFTYVCFSFCR
jgi:hypothetical protein